MSVDWQVVLTKLVELGVVAAVVRLILRRFEKKLDKRDASKEQKENARMEHDKLMLGMTFASLSLAEATAEAVQRIPDAHCNGDMHEALKTAKQAKAKYRSFQTQQSVEHLHGKG